MIVIQIRLATISLFILASVLLLASVGVLGLLLGIAGYADTKHMQIPSCLTGSAAILASIAHLAAVPWPYRPFLLTTNAVLALLLAASGLYFLSERVSDYTISHTPSYHRVELAFIVLWLVSLMVVFVLTAFAFGLMTEDSEKSVSPHESPLRDDEYLWQKPQPSYVDLGAAFDIPRAADMPQLSPQLSWPTTVGSMPNSPSFNSLRSALDMRAVQQQAGMQTAPSQLPMPHPIAFDQAIPSQDSAHTSPAKRLKLRLTGSLTDLTSSSPQSPPRSPLKLGLRKSTFSLKRESSRRNNTPPVDHSSTSLPLPMPQPAAPISAADIAPEMLKNFVIVPNESGSESRSVSGSSRVTGTLFPASEYNRKINAAGFQKDEPRPVRLEHVKAMGSQYDLERAFKTKGSV